MGKMDYINQKTKLYREDRPQKAFREMGFTSIREVQGDGNERKFVISFSSELPYERWWGSEILDHTDGCIDLTRLNEIGCLLFNHNRDKVIGKVNRAWIEDGKGHAEIEFDTDAEAETIYQKVKSGTLKGVSVGYIVDIWEEVAANKMSSDGRFNGPVSVAKRWTPFEVSIVSVPADYTVGVGREENAGIGQSLDSYERQLIVNKNLIGGYE